MTFPQQRIKHIYVVAPWQFFQPCYEEHLSKTGGAAAMNLVGYMEQHKIVFGSTDSTMTVPTIRLHLRILRRLSMAVVDTGAPVYQGSALYFFDKNEEIWGRTATQVALQESCRSFDSFQSALQNLEDLREASKNLHLLLLRGYNVKLTGRGIAELARGLVLYSKIPASLLPRFPKYADLLKPFGSLEAFHAEFPEGMYDTRQSISRSKLKSEFFSK